ncbi:MAG: cobyrinate a,c-diamide synthase [Candidatus Aquicultor sp.]
MGHDNTFPRILIAGTSSGVGKTTISLAIMAALSKRGLTVQGFKVGPDFIDPGYYQMVTGRPGRNIDTWMIGKEPSKACFVNSASDSDIAVIEGVMGLYDGRGDLSEGSTAEAAKLIESPVIMVVNCAKIGASAGAVAVGFKKYDEAVDLKGFILNNIGSDRHESMVKSSVERATGLPVLGCVKRNSQVKIPERHLGLVTQTETKPATEYIDALVELAEKHIDLDVLIDLANQTGLIKSDYESLFTRHREHDVQAPGVKPVRIGVALDKAFSFYYHDNFNLLAANGAELEFFSPLEDEHLPAGLDGLYLGGGYPEVYARELSQNHTMSAEIRQAVEDGVPVYAECGGLMYLSRAIENFDGHAYNMSGVLPVKCKMQKRPTLGYREVIACTDSVIASRGDILRGHEFHYSSITETGQGMDQAYTVEGGSQEGFVYKNSLASYIHMHFAGNPQAAERFISICRSTKKS